MSSRSSFFKQSRRAPAHRRNPASHFTYLLAASGPIDLLFRKLSGRDGVTRRRAAARLRLLPRGVKVSPSARRAPKLEFRGGTPREHKSGRASRLEGRKVPEGMVRRTKVSLPVSGDNTSGIQSRGGRRVCKERRPPFTESRWVFASESSEPGPARRPAAAEIANKSLENKVRRAALAGPSEIAQAPERGGDGG